MQCTSNSYACVGLAAAIAATTASGANFGCVGSEGSPNYFVGIPSCSNATTDAVAAVIQKCAGDTTSAVVVKCLDLGFSMPILTLEDNTQAKRTTLNAGTISRNTHDRVASLLMHANGSDVT